MDIYINDGKTADNTKEILGDFHERFPTVKVIEFNETMDNALALFAGFSELPGRCYHYHKAVTSKTLLKRFQRKLVSLQWRRI